MDQIQLRQLVHYDPLTGEFTWRERGIEHFKSANSMASWNTRRAGKTAGCVDGQRICLKLLHRNWWAHRLAFLYMTGSVPDLVDHADRNSLNNAFANLRPALRGQNRSNSKPTLARKLKGVYLQPSGRFGAAIRANRHTRWLGTFETEDLAAAAYDAAAIHLHGCFARTNAQLQNVQN